MGKCKEFRPVGGELKKRRSCDLLQVQFKEETMGDGVDVSLYKQLPGELNPQFVTRRCRVTVTAPKLVTMDQGGELTACGLNGGKSRFDWIPCS